MCRLPNQCHGAVVAELAGTVVGVASYERTSTHDRWAEFAVFVDDAQRGRGIGTLLLEHLAADARRHGVDELIGEVLPANSRMLRVARDLTARAWFRFDDGIVDVSVRTGTDEVAQRAVDDRERHAERAPVRPASRAVPGRRSWSAWPAGTASGLSAPTARASSTPIRRSG